MTAFENTFESIIEPRAKRFPLKNFEQINRSIIEVVKMLFDLSRNLCFFWKQEKGNSWNFAQKYCHRI